MIVTFLFFLFPCFSRKTPDQRTKGLQSGVFDNFHGLFQGFHPADDILAEHVSFKAMAFKPFARTRCLFKICTAVPIGVDMLVAKGMTVLPVKSCFSTKV